ncbi:hypothetical protein FMEAI12_2670010 [Parafrankia sp. Ea1.12]|nr:hypothetical protein FMEAI12_2670010 [Parafrankia sp. Ea1.12]
MGRGAAVAAVKDLLPLRGGAAGRADQDLFAADDRALPGARAPDWVGLSRTAAETRHEVPRPRRPAAHVARAMPRRDPREVSLTREHLAGVRRARRPGPPLAGTTARRGP